MYDKLEAVRQFREPYDSEEVRSFLGLVNYISKLIPNLATISEPLRRLTKKDIKFEWGDEQQIAFEKLKQTLSDELTLGYYDVKCPTQVIADASPMNNESRIISYTSRSLTTLEQNYAQTEKEALALVWAVERFHYFLFGRDFDLITDHKALETLFDQNQNHAQLRARIERWVIRLMSYKFKVINNPGKSNIADPFLV